MNKKLCSDKGESIGEVLIALLISSVGLVMLAAMITTSVRMLKQSRSSLIDYVAAENTVVEQSGGESGSITVKAGDTSIPLTDTSGKPIPVHFFIGSWDASHTVVSYKAD